MNRILVVVLIASLGGNAVLVARRFGNPPPVAVAASTQSVAANPAADRRASAPATPSESVSDAGAGADPARDFWSRLNTGDPRALLASLRAAGFGEDDAKAIVRARIMQSFEARINASISAIQNLPFWQGTRSAFLDRQRRAEMRQVQREHEAMLLDVLGESSTNAFQNAISMGSSLAWDPKTYPLSEEKQHAVSRILRDYMDITADVSMESGFGPQMPWEREKRAYIEAEKRKDLAAVLTPGELEIYELYASDAARILRRQLSGFEATEAEFRALVAIESGGQPGSQAGLFGRRGNLSSGGTDERSAKIKATLGETRYADYERVTDPGFQRAREITARLGLPADHATSAYQLGRDMQRRSAELRAVKAGSADERKAAMAALAQEANARLEALLTPAGARAYKNAGGSTWLQSIEAQGGVR